MLARRQFSLRSLFGATVWLAIASASVRYVAASNEPVVRACALLILSIAVCGTVGAFRGRAAEWVYYGAGAGLVLFGGVMLFSAVVR
jgi:hypothetical protein